MKHTCNSITLLLSTLTMFSNSFSQYDLPVLESPYSKRRTTRHGGRAILPDIISEQSREL